FVLLVPAVDQGLANLAQLVAVGVVAGQHGDGLGAWTVLPGGAEGSCHDPHQRVQGGGVLGMFLGQLAKLGGELVGPRVLVREDLLAVLVRLGLAVRLLKRLHGVVVILFERLVLLGWRRRLVFFLVVVRHRCPCQQHDNDAPSNSQHEASSPSEAPWHGKEPRDAIIAGTPREDREKKQRGAPQRNAPLPDKWASGRRRPSRATSTAR